MLKALGEQLGMKVIKLNDITIPAEMTELVGESMATAYKVVPLSQNKKDKSVTVVMAEPQNPSTLDSLRLFLGVDVKGAVASEADVMAAIERLYAGHHESIQDVVKQIEQDKGLAQLANRNANTIDLEAIEEMAEAAPVRKLLNMVLAAGHQGQGLATSTSSRSRTSTRCGTASTACSTRWCRRRGTSPWPSPAASRSWPTSTSPSAGCPRTAASSSTVGGNRVDLRVSILPTMFGESVVHARPRPHRSSSSTCDKLGMPEDTLASVPQAHPASPTASSWSPGPTGSGKTTTLYSALNELNEIDDKIITTEDPVEYDIDGPDPGADQPRHRPDLRQLPAVHPAPGPGHDPGRRDPRPGDGPDRRSRRR